jgi:hypothetical protein
LNNSPAKTGLVLRLSGSIKGRAEQSRAEGGGGRTRTKNREQRLKQNPEKGLSNRGGGAENQGRTGIKEKTERKTGAKHKD